MFQSLHNEKCYLGKCSINKSIESFSQWESIFFDLNPKALFTLKWSICNKYKLIYCNYFKSCRTVFVSCRAGFSFISAGTYKYPAQGFCKLPVLAEAVHRCSGWSFRNPHLGSPQCTLHSDLDPFLWEINGSCWNQNKELDVCVYSSLIHKL